MTWAWCLAKLRLVADQSINVELHCVITTTEANMESDVSSVFWKESTKCWSYFFLKYGKGFFWLPNQRTKFLSLFMANGSSDQHQSHSCKDGRCDCLMCTALSFQAECKHAKREIVAGLMLAFVPHTLTTNNSSPFPFCTKVVHEPI